MFYKKTKYFSFVHAIAIAAPIGSPLKLSGDGRGAMRRWVLTTLADTMKQTLTLITLGVQNFPAMKSWYKETFGWTPFQENDNIVFFKLNGGTVLSLFPAHELAEDIGVPQDGLGFKRFTLAINFRSEQEVDEATEDLRRKGVKIVCEPEKVFWGGYRGYIADPEDNYWELAYNPHLLPDD